MARIYVPDGCTYCYSDVLICQPGMVVTRFPGYHIVAPFRAKAPKRLKTLVNGVTMLIAAIKGAAELIAVLRVNIN